MASGNTEVACVKFLVRVTSAAMPNIFTKFYSISIVAIAFILVLSICAK